METQSSAELIDSGEEGSMRRGLGARLRRTFLWLIGGVDTGILQPTELDKPSPNHPDQFHILLRPENKKVSASCRSRLGFILAVLFFIFGVTATTVMWLTNVYDEGILKLVSIRNDIEVVFKLWEYPPTRPFLYVYVFNYTNYNEALRGREKPKLNEVGPFVFRETSQRVNIRFNDNNTVSFQEKKSIEFVPEMSAGSLNQTVRIPDLYLITMLNLVKDLFYLEQTAISLIASGIKIEPFQEVTIHDFVWGYRNPVFDTMKNISRLFHQDIQPFGYLKKRVGVHEEVLTVNTGWSELDSVAEIQRYDGWSKIGVWGETPCDLITASEGALFPGRKAQAHFPLYVYNKDLCRRLPLRYYQDTHSEDGFPVVEYRVPDDVFEYGNRTPENVCYKYKGEYPPNGVFRTSPCTNNVPIHISFPHFWRGSEELHKGVEGLRPDEDKHRSSFLIHDRLGVSLLVRTKFQMNIKLNKALHIHKFEGIKDGTILPVAWMGYDSGPLPDYFVNIVYHLTYTVRYVQRALKWLSLVALIGSVFLLYKQLKKRF